ncbi:MAG: glycosyltransferase family 2 protein, partial [Planctomycetaceae bacterium]|nr:glycosyltransferase family 2 protein [Planctomycetaceae bacterium]
MLQISDITALILTYNEAPNLRRCLERLRWAELVIVLDSGSTDETPAICADFPNVRFVCRAFDTFAGQCNFGLSLVRTSWTLSLDADYVLPKDFASRIPDLKPNAAGYFFQFDYCLAGKRLRCCLYPPRTVLYQTAAAVYQDLGHGHRVLIRGNVQAANMTIAHDDRKPLSRWLDSQRRYAAQEAEHLSKPTTDTGLADRVRRKIWLSLPAVIFYVLIVQRGILDGWPGLYYAFQRGYAELLLSLELLDRKLRLQNDLTTGNIRKNFVPNDRNTGSDAGSAT